MKKYTCKKYLLRSIAFFLAMIMMLGSISISAVALESNQKEALKFSESLDEPIAESQTNVNTISNSPTELIERREENAKHFRLENGTVRAISYAYPVHRKDNNGVWQDIDNQLFSNSEGTYSSKENRVSFAATMNKETFMTLNENGYSISMGYVSSNGASLRSEPIKVTNHLSADAKKASISSNLTQNEKLEKLTAIDNTTSVFYKNVQSGISLEYMLIANDIKENIIINSPQTDYSFKFVLQLDGLEAELMPDGSIILRDVVDGTEPYIIPNPYMVDANGVESTDVFYELESKKDGVYILTVTAENKWFDDISRAFPVTIDPYLQQRAHTDTYITAANPTLKPYSESTMWVGTNKISYIRPALNSIPQGSQVTFATLNVAYYFYSNVVDGTLNIGVYQVNDSWSSSLCWNTAQSMTNFGLSSTRTSYRTVRGDRGAYASSPQWQSFLITSIVNSWFNGSSNNGVGLKRESGTLSDVILYSANSGTTYAPYFTIDYIEPVVESGVYRLKNRNNYLYLTTAGTNYLTGAPLQQSSLVESVNGSINTAQLFKISYIRDYGNEHYYNIRPMTNSGLGLDAPITGTDFAVKANTISTTDEWFDIPQTQRWTIQTTGTNNGLRRVKIQNAFSDNGRYLTAPSTYTEGDAIVADTAGEDWYSEWYLEPYTGAAINGIKGLGIQKTITVGDTLTYRTYMYSSIVGCNGPVTYSVSNMNNSATDRASVNSSTGVLTALRAGTIKLNVTYAGAPTSWYWAINLYADTIAIGVVAAGGHDHSSALLTINPKLKACGYSNTTVYVGAFGTADVDNYLDTNTNNVFISRSHGNITVDINGAQTGTFITLDDEYFPLKYRSTGSIKTLDLSNMSLIMFIACYTGAGGNGGLNLPSVAVDQGAKTAVGFSESIGCNTANAWTIDFFNLMEKGISVYDACEQLGNDPRYSSTSMTSYVVCGNPNTRLN